MLSIMVTMVNILIKKKYSRFKNPKHAPTETNSSTVIWNPNKNIHSFEENMYKLLGMTSFPHPSPVAPLSACPHNSKLIVIEGKTNN